ncbi:MAG: 30S ribosomal protein S1 [Bdellovibrionaceae bacterium]|nr:30S ribosomal protein S1 [Pseudobdellovibrionaceae bacterium]MDW8190156.1 30S ribosomal protein S1 [Pseudobdellovibrionaceae bacterium]
MTKQHLSKQQQARLKAIALLDQADQEVLESHSKPNTSHQAIDHLFRESLEKQQFKVGDLVRGKVLAIHSDFVVVDINYKSEGIIDISEFRMTDGVPQVQVGDEVEVVIDKIENENGMVVLSKKKADMNRAWADISRAAENQEVVEGYVVSKVKGGLSVDIGVTAFLPGSQIDIRPVRNLDAYVGKTFKFKVIKFNKKRGNIVVSRRVLLEEEREQQKSQIIDQIREGAVVRGTVKNITEYGAFIDLGGVDGLLHITDMSWGRIKHPSDLIQVGDELELKVLKYDSEKERVSLGLKQLKPDPWETVHLQFPVGSRVKGKVVSLTEYGAFVDLAEGVEGLIHVSEMSWTKRIRHASQMLKEGEEVEVQVLGIDAANRRISLGMKQLQPNPWIELKESYPPGTIIEGEVKSVTDFGIFIGVEEGIDGLVRISDLSWTKRISNPADLYHKGQKVRAVVLGVDVENERFSLGIKQLEADPWLRIESKYGIGTQHEVKVTKVADFGAFVELENDIEGLIHVSELALERVEHPQDVVKVGDVVKAEVISIDRDARKVGLSAKLVKLREAKADVSEYQKKIQTSSRSTLGDLFADQLINNKKT